MFDNLLNPLLNPLLTALGTFWFVVLISFIVSFVTVIVYKYTTDQVLMKNLKEQIDKLNKDVKKNMNDQKKVMAMQKEMFAKQMVMMRHSFTSTFITLLPILILFSWLTAHVAYAPITDGEQFTVSVMFEDYKGNVELVVPKGMEIIDNATKGISSKVDWRLSGNAGDYLLEWNVGDKSYTKEVLIGNEYSTPTQSFNDGIVKSIQINYKKSKVMPFWPNWGWLGTYILFAIIFSMLLRKVLKVY